MPDSGVVAYKKTLNRGKTSNEAPKAKASPTGSSIGFAGKNFCLWLTGIIVSAIPVLITPVAQLGMEDHHINWFNDIFNNYEILIISVCLGVPALFQFFTKKQTNLTFLFSCFLFISSVFCIFLYSEARGISEFAKLKDVKQPEYQLGAINLVILSIMFVLRSVSFIGLGGGKK